MMFEKKAKIVMVAMFRNESAVMRRMLESCYKYIDYWVIQNNGSTDGTDQIVKDFFKEHPVPGVLYDVEEGWVGFGWNRDHLIQKCQSIDHSCDWILKMDCDEVLEVDDDFDWSLLEDKSIFAFNVPAVYGNSTYFRAWLWNADIPWRFNHDPCHETIYCSREGIGENFERKNLPNKIRQIGFSEGQSWQNPTKFITDALKLEERLIREDTILTDTYHFWYIGKSYFDACFHAKFPLGESQKKEYARRTIYYFEEYVKEIHKFNTVKENNIHEMSYMALLFTAECYSYLEQYQAAEMMLKFAEDFAPKRNEHLVSLAHVYERIKDYDRMFAVTKRLISTDRKNPFPEYSVVIDNNAYYDTGDYVKELHKKALSYILQN